MLSNPFVLFSSQEVLDKLYSFNNKFLTKEKFLELYSNGQWDLYMTFLSHNPFVPTNSALSFGDKIDKNREYKYEYYHLEKCHFLKIRCIIYYLESEVVSAVIYSC